MMQVITIDSLLKSAIPCSSSSTFVSESFSSQSVISPGVNHPVLASEGIQNVLGKRTRHEQKAQRNGRPNRQMIKVLPQCCVIVGRLQLCNRNVHYWNGLFVPADCVALTDSSATICCCICQGPDPSFLGKTVRVNSWNFIPQNGAVLTRVQSSRPLNPDGQLGILEIHNLELVEGQSSEETRWPSIFVSPLAANGQKDVEEIPPEQQETLGRGLILRGIPRCISPPFILPCKSSVSNGKLPSQAGNSRMQEREERNNEKFARDPTLGFFVEIQFCSACSPSSFDMWKNSVKRERFKPRKLDEIRRSTDLPGQPPSASSTAEHSETTTQQGPVEENFSSSSRPSDVAGTLCSKTRSKAGGGLSHVYFSGPVAAWRPVLSGALGQCVSITGLRKKLILLRNDKRPQIVYLATQKTFITLDCQRELYGEPLKGSPLQRPEGKSLDGTLAVKERKMDSDPSNTQGGNLTVDGNESPVKKSKIHLEFGTTFGGFRAFEKGKDSSGYGHGDHMCVEEGNCRGLEKDNRVISFVGFVTDSLFQGTLLELDQRVWLLLTHQRHTKLHGLRIGAMLSLREVHPITIKDVMGRSLLLGACMRSHLSVVLFSPFPTKLLSLIGSFRQKFRNIYGDKELLGGKKDPGIIQKYAQRMIAPDEILERDLVKEFFHKQNCKLGDGLPSTPIMQVPPIANFCKHVEALWQSYRSLDKKSESENSVSGQGSGTAKCNVMRQSSASGQLRQLTITSQELGIILLGSLQVCQTSGKLCLLDATGSVDVLIPDLLSSEHLSRTYQVSRFTLKLEGLDQACPSGNDGIGAMLISWSSLLKDAKPLPSSELVKYSVHFLIRDATYLHDLDRHENVIRQSGPLYHSKQKGWWQKQMQDWWAKTKPHLDFLRLWFQSQTREVAGICCSNQGLGILSELVGPVTPNDDLFKVNCKVVGVRLLVLEWPCVLASFEVRNTELPSWLGAKGSATSWKPAFGVPLTLACFVVDDGSGPADCWALGDAAVSLLGLSNFAGQLNLPFAMLERICTNLPRVFEMQPVMGLSLDQILCRMTQRYGQIVFQNMDPCGDPTGSRSLMNSKGGHLLNDDEQSLMHLVVSHACLNGPLAIVGRNIPSMENICSADTEKGTGSCELLACWSPRSQTEQSLVNSRATLLAHRVDPINYISDLTTLIEQVAGLLQD